MSPTTPAVSRKAARVGEDASPTHCRSEKLECSSRWMSGSATFTTVMSRRSMNVAVQTAISVHHLRSRAATQAQCTEAFLPLVQCAVIVGSSLTIEIGDRTLLSDASFVVGAGEKVGLVGRNGTGKSSFISVLVGEA